MELSEQFNDLVNRFYDDYFGYNPTLGREMGFHRYLGKVPDFAYETIMGFYRRLQFYEIEVSRLKGENLTPQQQADLTQLGLTICYEKFAIQQLRWWAENPIAYARHLDVSHYVKRDYASLETRAKHTSQHLRHVPQLLEQQRFNLKPVQPVINLTTTIGLLRGYQDYYAREVVESFKSIKDPTIAAELSEGTKEATSALDRFIRYLENELLPNATDEFAIGRFNFLDMLRYGEMVDLTIGDLLKVGEADLERNRIRFEEVTSLFMPGRTAREAMRQVANNHPSADTLIDETRSILEEMRGFVVEKEIVTIPSEARVQVAETPDFMRWAFALCDTPGPFEKKATNSYYYVTNVRPDWSRKKQEEWLTKFDYATLDNVSVHEAYPGHYVHYLHTLSAPSKVAKIAGAYSFWEGWAHYAEQMMLEEGWHESDPRYQLAQLSEALLRDCRYICAIQMHAGEMTVNEATSFFMENSFMEETPARKEAERGTYDPGYLNYTLGKLMILRLRKDWRKQEGRRYSLKRFHDRLLSFGAPPIPLVRKLMLKEGHDEAIL